MVRLKQKLAEFWCSLWGCRMSDGFPGCERCGAALYGDWWDVGRLRKLQECWWWIRYSLPSMLKVPRCAECGKRMPYGTPRGSCCSEECWHRDVPF